MVKISIIAAIGKDRELGKDNKLLWRIPEDLKRFRKLTQGHAVIMGRKTFESIGKPLPDRLNVIITRDKNYFNVLKHYNNVIVYNSLEQVMNNLLFKIKNLKFKDEVFVIGGGQIFTLALPHADKLYLTIVDDVKNADTFFPDYSTFKKVVYKEIKEHNGLSYTFLDLVKE